MHLPTFLPRLAIVAAPLLLFAVLATVALAQSQPTLTNRGAAPEWTNNAWLNSEQPLRLAIARGFVEAHGGRITVESGDDGTAFGVWVGV